VRQATTGTLLVLGAAAGFGTIGIFGELAIAAGLSLSTLLPARFALATAFVLALAAGGRWGLPDTGRQWAATLALGVVYTGLTLAYFASLDYLTAGLATVVLYTYPAFVVVLSAATLDESVSTATLAALGCSLAGVVLIVGVDPAGVSLTGVALALVAAGCYAVYTVGSRTVVASLAPRSLMSGALVGTTVSMTVFGALADGLALPAGTEQWGIVVGIAVVGTVLPLVLFYEGVERLAASRVGIVSTVEPLVTVALGAIVLDERITPGLLAGGTLVLVGVVLVQRDRGDGRPPSDAGAADRGS